MGQLSWTRGGSSITWNLYIKTESVSKSSLWLDQPWQAGHWDTWGRSPGLGYLGGQVAADHREDNGVIK